MAGLLNLDTHGETLGFAGRHVMEADFVFGRIGRAHPRFDAVKR